MTRNTSRLSRFAALLLAATASIGLPAAAFAEGDTAPAVTQAPPAIRVVAAEKQELVETLSVNGTVVPREEAAVGSDLNGLTVVALNADIGDTVKKGDVLAVLDRSMLDTQLAQMVATRAQAVAAIEQSRAQIADAEVGVRQANEALERAQALQQKGFTADAQRDNAVNAADSAKAKLEMARRALAASEAQLGVIDAQTNNVKVQIAKTELKAPADGLILSRDATLGGVVMAGSAPLFRLAIGGEFEFSADVSETVLTRLEVGMPVSVTVGGVVKPIEGAIRRVSPEVAKASRLGEIRVSYGPGSPARSGNFGRGIVELVRREGIAVPTSALIYKSEEAFLQLVDNGTVKTVPVEVGVRAGKTVEIVSGIAEGQEVVSRAGTFVADGDLVTPVRGEMVGAVKP